VYDTFSKIEPWRRGAPLRHVTRGYSASASLPPVVTPLFVLVLVYRCKTFGLKISSY